MSYFYEKILEIIKEVKEGPHATADEIVQMLVDEGVLDDDEEEG